MALLGFEAGAAQQLMQPAAEHRQRLQPGGAHAEPVGDQG
jgi:hypothetical protein